MFIEEKMYGSLICLTIGIVHCVGLRRRFSQQEASLFEQLATYFTTAIPASEMQTPENLQKDIAAYVKARAVADAFVDCSAPCVCGFV